VFESAIRRNAAASEATSLRAKDESVRVFDDEFGHPRHVRHDDRWSA